MTELLNWTACLWLALSGAVQPAQGTQRSVPETVRALFDAGSGGQPRYEVRSTNKHQGFELREISYPSPHGGTVSAFLLIPEGKGPYPAVVYGHWGNGTSASFLPEAMMLARAGVVSFIPDAPFARALDSYKPANGSEAREVYVQMVVDIRRGLDLLDREPSVDKARIGYAGLSFGAQVGAILSSVDRRIKAFVIMGGLPSLARQLETGEQPFTVRLRESIKDKEAFRTFLSRLSEIDSERFVRGEHPPILFQFGTYDAAIPEAAAREFVAATTEPREVRWYTTGHDFNDLESLNDRFAWLGKQLGFRPPCAAAGDVCKPAAKQ